MGSAGSKPSPGPTPDDAPRQSRAELEEARLERQRRSELEEARQQAARHGAVARSALSEANDLRQQLESGTMYAAAAAAGSAAVAAALTAVLVRRRNAAALVQAQQSIVDMRVRSAGALEKAERFGAEGLAKSLLSALDSVDALVGAPDAEGAALTRESLQRALREHGVQRLEPSVGEPFDVGTMEGMFNEPSAPKGMVATVLRPGYSLHERLLRPAQVGVGADGSASA